MELPDKSSFSTDPSLDTWNDMLEVSKKTAKKQPTRRNPWGNRSYADLITQAIQNAPEQRLTLSQIYDWMVKNVPHFKDKGENNSSAGWKNSIRHNLSLHTRFVRMQNDITGKSSWWIIDPDGGDGRVTRRRPSAKGDRSRTYRRQRSKPKTQLTPITKCLPAQDQTFTSSSFNRTTRLGNNCNVSLSQYFPCDPSWPSDCGQRQRWHSSSSSSCSSEEVGLESRKIFRTVSPAFQQPCSPLSDRNSSGFSSPSSEGELGNAFAVHYPVVCTLSTFQDGIGRWVRSPKHSGPYPQSMVSLDNPWNEPNDTVQCPQETGVFQREVPEESNPFQREDYAQLANQLVEDQICSFSAYSPNPDVSSQCTISMIDGYDVSRDYEDFDTSDGQHPCSLYQNRGRVNFCSLSNVIPVDYLMDDSLPVDLRTCHVLPGIECNVKDVIAHEIKVEGQLMFLDCFDDSWIIE